MEGALLFGKYSGLATASAVVQNHQVLIRFRARHSTFGFLVKMIMFTGRFWHMTQAAWEAAAPNSQTD